MAVDTRDACLYISARSYSLAQQTGLRGIEDACAGLAGGLFRRVYRDVVVCVNRECVHGGGLFSVLVQPGSSHELIR